MGGPHGNSGKDAGAVVVQCVTGTCELLPQRHWNNPTFPGHGKPSMCAGDRANLRMRTYSKNIASAHGKSQCSTLVRIRDISDIFMATNSKNISLARLDSEEHYYI